MRGKLAGSSSWAIDEIADLKCTAGGISYALSDGRMYVLPWDGVVVRRSVMRDRCVTIEGRAESGERLFFEAPEKVLRLFRRQAPSAFQAQLDSVSEIRTMERWAMRRQVITLAVVFLFLGGFSLLCLELLPDIVVSRFPVEWEAGLGASTVGMSCPSEDKAGDDILDKAVKQVWQRVLSGLEANPYHFRVRVVPASEVNAFAAPGGYIVVYTGLVARCTSPEELAGVLGHEAQHVIRRHSLKAMVRAAEWRILVALVSGRWGGDGAGARVLQDLACKAGDLHYSRNSETEADRGAVKTLLRAHVDPMPLTRFFERLGKEEAFSVPFLSTHPSGASRQVDMQNLIRQMPTTDFKPIVIALKSVSWEDVRKAARVDSR